MTIRERQIILEGITYKLKVPNHMQEIVNLYITINHDEHDRPCEVFIRCDDHVLHEHLNAFAIMVSKILQLDVHLNDIAEPLKTVPSPLTAHYIPGTKIQCPSIYARIGYLFIEHTKKIRTYCQEQTALDFHE